ncbi:rhomboid family intramembrane serine protease [Myxococcota bacterium]|nr:rhomboid family intramembrane serine protease [Myxococcota bacterium]
MNTPIRTTPKRQVADEWALVLTSENLDSEIHKEGNGYELSVRNWDAERAIAVLELYDNENPPAPLEDVEAHHPAALNSALAVMGTLAIFFFLTSERDSAPQWFERGSANADRILLGETWRTVTALTLHADLSHILGNLFAGSVFLFFAGRTLGPGLALFLAVLAGAGGNFVNAFAHGTNHISVGASTSVFGAIGLLGGRGAVHRARRGAHGHRRMAPIAASLALVAMLGTGSSADLGAHVFGLLMGAALGAAAALSFRQHPPSWVQWTLAASTFLAVAYAWKVALS